MSRRSAEIRAFVGRGICRSQSLKVVSIPSKKGWPSHEANTSSTSLSCTSLRSNTICIRTLRRASFTRWLSNRSVTTSMKPSCSEPKRLKNVATAVTAASCKTLKNAVTVWPIAICKVRLNTDSTSSEGKSSWHTERRAEHIHVVVTAVVASPASTESRSRPESTPTSAKNGNLLISDNVSARNSAEGWLSIVTIASNGRIERTLFIIASWTTVTRCASRSTFSRSLLDARERRTRSEAHRSLIMSLATSQNAPDPSSCSRTKRENLMKTSASIIVEASRSTS
mmetsp:Transcript_64056/g.146742  ORF Transcript_64056/g.146742 Transcript_64056/m.146742 type:complete len:283 (-) Transcript_64056:1334-2182(-)